MMDYNARSDASGSDSSEMSAKMVRMAPVAAAGAKGGGTYFTMREEAMATCRQK